MGRSLAPLGRDRARRRPGCRLAAVVRRASRARAARIGHVAATRMDGSSADARDDAVVAAAAAAAACCSARLYQRRAALYRASYWPVTLVNTAGESAGELSPAHTTY